MIVFNHDLLFVHSPKTAGTSIIALLEASLPEARTAGVAELGTHHPHLDQALTYARAVTGQRDFKCVFVVARDPFDREISMYSYFRNVLHGSPLMMRNLNNIGLQAAVAIAARTSFGDYLKEMRASFRTCDLWRSRYYYESELSGPMDALRILRFETLETELHALLDGYLTGRTVLPHLNRGDRGDETSIYDDESREIVADSYAWMFTRGLYAHPDDGETTRAIRELAALMDVQELAALDALLKRTERQAQRLLARGAGPSLGNAPTVT